MLYIGRKTWTTDCVRSMVCLLTSPFLFQLVFVSFLLKNGLGKPLQSQDLDNKKGNLENVEVAVDQPMNATSNSRSKREDFRNTQSVSGCPIASWPRSTPGCLDKWLFYPAYNVCEAQCGGISFACLGNILKYGYVKKCEPVTWNMPIRLLNGQTKHVKINVACRCAT